MLLVELTLNVVQSCVDLILKGEQLCNARCGSHFKGHHAAVACLCKVPMAEVASKAAS